MSTATLTDYGRRAVEQARRLNVHPNTVYRWLRRGLVGTLRGAVWYVRDEDIEEFFAAKTAARLGQNAPTSAAASASHEAADRALERAGW
jgi:hypothetical protein